MRFARALLTVLMVAVVSIIAAGTAQAVGSGPGTVRFTMVSPVAGSTVVELHRINGGPDVRHTAVQTGMSTDMVLPAGTYSVVARVMTSEGLRYVGRASRPVVAVTEGSSRDVTLTYTKSTGPQGLRVSGLAPRAIELAWDAERSNRVVVRRVEGTSAALNPSQGTSVRVAGTSVLDESVRPGVTYTYSIFTSPGDIADGNVSGDPVTITVGTPAEVSTPGEASFVLNPRTQVLDPADVTAAEPTGDGVRLTLAAGRSVPTPGDFLSVPVSASLRGGYLGEVVAIATDGRSVDLRPAALGAAFDYYTLDVPDFGSVPAPAKVAAGPATAPLAPLLSSSTEESRARADRAAGQSRGGSLLAQKSAALAGKVECNVAGGLDVQPDLETTNGGHASVSISKYEIKWLPDIPNGFGWDLAYSETNTGTVDIEAENALECGLPLPNFFKQLTLYPVPIAIEARPELNVTVSSKGSVENLGFSATTGFSTDGYVGLEGDDFVDGDVIDTNYPTEATGKGTFGLGVEIGGSIAFGPGVGTAEAGVLVGIGGELYVLDASASVVQVDDGDTVSTCVEFSAETKMGIYLTLRAWLPGYEYDATLTIDELTGSFPWGGSPWHWPDDCTDSEAPTDDVVGDGVTPIEDELTGQSDQWGKVEGFVPGESTWVLSTGRVGDAVGSPSFFASTQLGSPGDTRLSELSGFPTYDAAAFAVTVIPNGETLNIRYAFASEEYPEYVGSRYNDVMAVLVDGQNCALVPGTQTPVSINSVNQSSNSEYYVDNSAGAAGYNTTMDGLTKPLTCAVPVVPGEPVRIRIAVADASDSAYDSAIALLDGGIWSE